MRFKALLVNVSLTICIYVIWTSTGWDKTYTNLFNKIVATVWLMLIGGAVVLTNDEPCTFKTTRVLIVCVENDCVFCKEIDTCHEDIIGQTRNAYSTINKESLRILNTKSSSHTDLVSLLDVSNVGWPEKNANVDVVVFVGGHAAVLLGVCMHTNGYWPTAQFIFVKETPSR